MKGYWRSADAFLSDEAAAAAMRRLAVSLRVDSRAALSTAGARPGRIEELSRMAARVPAEGETAAMPWIRDNCRMVAGWARALDEARGVLLPAEDGVARISVFAEELLSRCDARLTRERVKTCLAAFDETQSLTMREIWLVPAALRCALCALFLRAATHAIEEEKQRAAAEKWINDGADIRKMGAPSCAFTERALQLMHEREMPRERRALEGWLDSHASGAAVEIHAAHERQAMDRLFLQNAMGSLRLLEEIDWAEEFEALSRAAQALCQDPAGLYGRMDEDSRRAVRDMVEDMALRTGLMETTLALSAAHAAAEEKGERASCVWYLASDAGRRALERRLSLTDGALGRVTPDPRGTRYICLPALLTLLFAAATLFAGKIWLTVLSAPVLWRMAMTISARASAARHKPRPLLKLALDKIPDDMRTLVVVPALLPDRDSARARVEGLETLGCLEEDPNVDFLLLGDFRDGPNAAEIHDGAIAREARMGVEALNRRAGRNKYHYLQRRREYSAREGRYMGRERKRGALMDLNEYLLGGEGRFIARDDALPGRFRYVVTLDADTRLLPGAVRALTGAAAHPLNRNYAVIVPRMEQTLRGASAFSRRVFGAGGTESYPVAASNALWDACGRGAFGGKGIYDVRAFTAAVTGRLPDGLILSHDLIEGILAGAAYAGDITLYETPPARLSSYLKRLDRWTRGDWQLLPVLGRADALSRFLALDNMALSLAPACAMALLLLSMWLGEETALLLAALYVAAPVWSALPCVTKDNGRRALTRLLLLPMEGWVSLRAAVTALWRVYVSGRDRLVWVTSAEADGQSGGKTPYGKVAAILLIPALFRPLWTAGALALIALFFFAEGYLSAPDGREGTALSPEDRRDLAELARRTWRFFERNVPLDGAGLPPDNVQIDPPLPPAKRTSPTNVGLYMASCVAAGMLGLVGEDEKIARLAAATDTLEKLDKWRGHMYNWYDIDTLKPLEPLYVSSVDGGNLAACLLLCEAALGETNLARRIGALARRMDFTALYDEKRRLFAIGRDVGRDRLSESRYDLLASESRILSIVAMALGQAPVKHWRALARGAARTDGGAALLSWSGTMFEYMMPELFMRAEKGSLLYETCLSVARAQIAYGGGGVWGVSESGYNAFDQALNYQYRAFGIPGVSLRGGAGERVFSPYASVLALPFSPDRSVKNLRRMREEGLMGEDGLYEAVDMEPSRLLRGRTRAVVKSHMAHHQGMILCAVCNALTQDGLCRLFGGIPQMRALSLLLEERPPRATDAARRPDDGADAVPARKAPSGRDADPRAAVPETHLLSGGGGTRFVTATGLGFYMAGGVMVNRFLGGDDNLFIHVRAAGAKRSFIANGGAGACRMNPGEVKWTTRTEDVECRVTECVSPEDGALVQRVEIASRAQRPVEVEITGCFAVALAAQEDMRAHPCFQNLFVESARPRENALIFRRRPRRGADDGLRLVYMLVGADEVSCETDMFSLVGREGDMARPGGIARTLTGAVGHTLNPCAALRARCALDIGQRRAFSLVTALTRDTEAFFRRHEAGESAERARLLACTQARAMLDFLGVAGQAHSLYQRMGAYLFPEMLARMPAPPDGAPPETRLSVSGLWALGISGDLPILCAFVRAKEQIDAARAVLRMHEFYRSMGVPCDAVLVNDYGNDYDQPVRDMLFQTVASGHLRGAVGEKGGAHLLEGALLTGVQRALLRASAAVTLDGDGGGVPAQLRRRLDAPAPGESPFDAPSLPAGKPALARVKRLCFNGWGGFTADGREYAVDILPGKPTPAPWSNILANGHLGALVTERGGGFTFGENSRFDRLTAFMNDPLREGWGEEILLYDRHENASARILPGPGRPQGAFRVFHRPGATRFESSAEGLRWSAEVFVDWRENIKCVLIDVENTSGEERHLSLMARVRWLMGVSVKDARLVRAKEDVLLIAAGAMRALGFAAFAGRDGAMRRDFILHGGAKIREELLLGTAPDEDACLRAVARWRAEGGEKRLRDTLAHWNHMLSRVTADTGDTLADAMLNRFLPYQAIAGRILARTGLYQGGGAFGFRDQLQDVLCTMHIDPDRAREHILLCAAHQFRDGDVQHWWHPPATGVRTRITDDLLFLPYVAAHYARETGDAAIFTEIVPYLENETIPEGDEDYYGAARVSSESDTLLGHCLRAIRRAGVFGAHGLPLMGGGDWNDGMNRIGEKGAGESVWLAEFLIVTSEALAEYCGGADAEYLRALARDMRQAIEKNAWDGAWYLRAYTDEGTPVGSHAAPEGEGCRIDVLSQSWAVLAGLDDARARRAMDAVWEHLVDEDRGIIRLLTPPFDAGKTDPGYIRGYPPGVRENGGQYTHAACWAAMAYARLGDATRAWRALTMLMPYTHADTREKAQTYRVEPYVVAADIYEEGDYAGRGGWTWYTGAAGWLCRTALTYLLGYTRRGDTVALHALLPPDRDSVSVTLRYGESTYKLICRRDCLAADAEEIQLRDDGRAHEATFPPRVPKRDPKG